jgi:PAS domain S-box-containing protein
MVQEVEPTWWEGQPTEAVLRQVLDALADGILLADEAGQIVLASQGAAAMFGYRPGQLVGRPVESLMPAGLREKHRLDRAAYALNPTVRPMADRARLVGLCEDGTTIPVTITLSPIPIAGGHLILAVVRDVTQELGQDDLTHLVNMALAQQARHTGGLIDRVVSNLFHVGLSLNRAADQPAELARERIGEALQRLDEIIREIRDHVFRSPPLDDDGSHSRR